MKRRVLVATLTACLLLAIAAGGTSAREPSAKATIGALGDPDFGPTIGDGYVYWTRKAQNRSRTHTTTKLHRLEIATNQVTLVKTIHDGVFGSLYAAGGLVAFDTYVYESKVKGKRNEFTHAVWTLPAGGTTPTAVETAKTYTRVTKKTSRVKGKLHTVTTYESCGPSVELAGLSDAHQLLLYRSSYNCLPNGHSSETTSGAIHNLDTGAEIPSKAVRESVYATIQDNLLITSEWDDVVIRDLATNAFRKFKLDDLVWQVAVAPSGEVITVSDAHKAGDRISRISIFAPGTTTNPIKLDSAWLSAPTVELCAGGFVELREKRGEKMRIVLHSMTGAIEAVLAGPRSGLGYDTSCTGRHLTLAATANAGPPQVFNYDL